MPQSSFDKCLKPFERVEFFWLARKAMLTGVVRIDNDERFDEPGDWMFFYLQVAAELIFGGFNGVSCNDNIPVSDAVVTKKGWFSPKGK